MKATIHVHQAEARKKDPEEHPAIIIRTYKGSTHHKKVVLQGIVKVLHLDEPDSCGATVVMECEGQDIVYASGERWNFS